MTIDISNNAARVNYTVASGVTQTSFSVPFEFFNDSDLSVYVDDVLKTITTHYTASGGDGSTGTITMSVTGAAGGSTVVISRSIAIERTSDFQTGVDINRAALNTQLDTLTAIAADNQDKANRSISAPNSEVNPVLELPDADTRKGKLIGFNETTGNIELSATLADGNTLASISGDIATLADIEDGTDATDAIQTVAGISSNVTTVAGISSNVTSVAGNESNINTVAADGTDIGTVASSIASVNTAAANITEIQNASANAATATTKAAEAATSASNAATSEGNASTSEANAATSASTATTKAGISTTKAAESAASAAAALASENAAATSESNASISESNASNSATLSEASRIASVAAQAAAETAETNAETAETNAASSASAASTSASNASTSETNAATSAATATTQAGIATTKAGEAATSATSAASSASSAQASKDAALAALDSFDDRYLGQKTADPTVDNDGDALVAGALYFNTTDDVMKVYEGSTWVAAYASLSGALLVANNLSDLASASAGRTNLGLGTAATTAATDYATAAQGTLADSATQPGDLGTAATSAATDFVAVTGDSMTGDLSFGDNDKAIFGAGSDLQIYHDGSNSYVQDAGDGALILNTTNGGGVYVYSAGETMATFNSNGAVNLYYDNAAKLATTATGVDVTGTVEADNAALGNFVYAGQSGGLYLDGGYSTRITATSYGTANQSMLFYTGTGSGSERMRIDSSGNVGIGTSSPSQVLHVESSSVGVTRATVINTGNAAAGAGVQFVTKNGATQVSNATLRTDNAGNFSIFTGTTGEAERMRIDSSGNLLVGTTSSATNDVGFKVFTTGQTVTTASGTNPVLFNRKTSDGDIAIFRKDDSTVGSIGVAFSRPYFASPTCGISPHNTANYVAATNSTGTTIDNTVDLGASGYRWKDGHFSGTVNAANFNTTSDATLKTNVETLTGSLDAVKALRGVSFDWLENGNSEVGVIAQEVEAVLPDVVSTNDQGIKSVKYGNMVALLIEAMKEQQAQIDELKAKLGE